jgi:hypothetical protein
VAKREAKQNKEKRLFERLGEVYRKLGIGDATKKKKKNKL